MRKITKAWPEMLLKNQSIRPRPTGPKITTDVARPSWDEVWFTMAETIAERSRCSRAKIGCVVVAQDQTVISCSYAGPPPDYEVSGPCINWCDRAKNADTDLAYSTCISSHAEMNAVARADWSRTENATAYITGSCCLQCAKLLAAAKVSRVVHCVSDTDSHRRPELVEAYLRKCGIDVQRV